MKADDIIDDAFDTLKTSWTLLEHLKERVAYASQFTEDHVYLLMKIDDIQNQILELKSNL